VQYYQLLLGYIYILDNLNVFWVSFSFIPLFLVGRVWVVAIRFNKSGGGASVALYATRPSWPMSLWPWALAAARGPVGLLL